MNVRVERTDDLELLWIWAEKVRKLEEMLMFDVGRKWTVLWVIDMKSWRAHNL
ncbi:hypothetical protein [Archaeoglobus neptunius]|uniref:hypothetical protein n=1 Tax=Archaeoglobus neptunius TaxID=2798580 RepID=UPI0019266A46|nr:hypothetical protein [Archaeoglobus neptunius]